MDNGHADASDAPSAPSLLFRAENQVHFYYVPERVMGFAREEDTVQLLADVDDDVGEDRLCWSLVPGRGGWRAGEDRNLVQSYEYEKVVMVWQQP